MLLNNSVSTSKDFISTFQEIIEDSSEIIDNINFGICVFDYSNKSFICYFDNETKKVSVEQRKSFDWKNKINFKEEPHEYFIKGNNSKGTYIYAAPIFIDNQPQYYLSIPYYKEYKELEFSVHVLADYIGYRVVNQRTKENIFLKSEYQEIICEATSEGYLTINKSGELTYLNRVGGKILELDPKQVLNKNISELFDYHEQMIEVLNTGKGWVNRDFFISKRNKRIHIIKSAIPLIDDKSHQLVGSIFIFREMKNVRNMVGEIVGNKARYEFADIKYVSQEMRELIDLAKAAATTDSSILIESKSGTGKELLAQAIHNQSNRSKGPFITIDCSSIPRDLIESELFGYVEGAFTGARKNGKFGKFELSHEGTIFLDEIGEMPLEMQSKLLRVIQTRSVTRVGGTKQIPVNFRIIAATNRNLEEEISNSNFRLDLFYRLNVIYLTIPPLRNRIEDISLLANLFIEKTAKREFRIPPILSDDALEQLINYSWPGNVRELENVMERATLLSENKILPRHLPKYISRIDDKIDSNVGTSKSDANSSKGWEEVEKQLIVDTLKKTNNNRSRSAKILGISRSTLYDKLKKYEIIIK